MEFDSELRFKVMGKISTLEVRKLKKGSSWHLIYYNLVDRKPWRISGVKPRSYQNNQNALIIDVATSKVSRDPHPLVALSLYTNVVFSSVHVSVTCWWYVRASRSFRYLKGGLHVLHDLMRFIPASIAMFTQLYRVVRVRGYLFCDTGLPGILLIDLVITWLYRGWTLLACRLENPIKIRSFFPHDNTTYLLLWMINIY